MADADAARAQAGGPWLRSEAIGIGACIAAFVALALLSIRSEHNWGGDFAAYLMQMQSWLAGEIDAYIAASRFTIEGSSHAPGPVLYPWGFPLLLTLPFVAVGGDDLYAFKLLNVVAYAGFLLALHALVRRRLPWYWSLPVVAIFALNPVMLGSNDRLLSDLPFLVLSTAALAWIDVWSGGPQLGSAPPQPGNTRRSVHAALLGALVFAAFSIRTLGLLLLAALLVVQWRERRRGMSVLEACIPHLAFGLLWIGSSVWLPTDGTRLEYLRDLTLEGVLSSLAFNLRAPSLFFQSLPGSAWWNAGLGLLAVVGISARARRDAHLWVYGALILGSCVLWPFTQGLRLLLPALPLYLYAAAAGAYSIVVHLPARGRPAAVGVLACSVLLVVVPFARDSIAYTRYQIESGDDLDGPYHPTSRELFDFVRHETARDAVIVFFKPRVMRLMTGRASVLLNEPARLAEADYVVHHRFAMGRAQLGREQLERACGACPVVFENASFVVLRTR